MPKKEVLRQCVACRESKNKNELLRICRTTEGDVCVDLTGRMNGRGVYLCKDESCVELSFKRKALDKSLKIHISDVRVDELKSEILEVINN